MSTPTPLAPNEAENAANAIDKELNRHLRAHKQTVTALTAYLNETKKTDGTLVPASEITASRPRLVGISDYLAATQALIVTLTGSTFAPPTKAQIKQAQPTAPVLKPVGS